MRRPYAHHVTTPAVAAAVAAVLAASSALAGGLIRAPAVGGVYIDAEGVVTAPPAEGSEQLRAAWQAGLEPAPADLQPLVDQRFVSLRGLNEKLAEVRKAGLPVPDEVRYLAGLLRVKHVLVYPPTEERPGDIVLAGPAEGWRVDRLGNTVGVTTGRPVLMLDDLVVALRAAEGANGPGISCSIDPTPEGLARAQQVTRRLNPGEGPLMAARRLEQAYGRQVVSVAGVPASSHFARSLVAADFRMKQIAMGFEPAPVGGLPSYLEMVNVGAVKGNLLPRWWLASNYQPLGRDKDGLAWELRGQGVKCLSEEDFVDAQGELTRGGGRDNTDADRWAGLFTQRFDELADHDSSFGHVRNAFDLAVVASLLTLEDLWTVAELATPQLAVEFEPEEYATPKYVATQASFLKRGAKWVITASGGVQVFPWQVADKSEESPQLAELRESQGAANADAWWWQ
ncbi:DUF1598 domain-containing protein [Botrimarina sp.]|uniref:DUF1598 domain-containing protein n=1 Tax=Botrimarina sp. TaxID=2795802 RepID=UPI0032EE695D